VCAEFKSPPENGPYCSRIHGQIYYLVSPLCPNQANKPGYGQLHMFSSAEAAIKHLKDQTKCVSPKECNDWMRFCENLAHLLSHLDE
jgi:hypothetical protein